MATPKNHGDRVRELVMAFQKGECSIGEVTDAAMPLIKRVVGSFRELDWNSLVTEDIVQDTLVLFATKIVFEFDGARESIVPLVVAYAKNTMRQHLDRERRYVRLDSVMDKQSEGGDSDSDHGGSHSSEALMIALQNKAGTSHDLVVESKVMEDEIDRNRALLTLAGKFQELRQAGIAERNAGSPNPVEKPTRRKTVYDKSKAPLLTEQEKREQEEFMDIRKALGLTLKQFAQALGPSLHKMRHYSCGRTRIPPELIASARELGKQGNTRFSKAQMSFEGKEMCEILADWAKSAGVPEDDMEALAALLDVNKKTIGRWQKNVTRPSWQALYSANERVNKKVRAAA